MPPNLGGFFMVRSYYPSECHADYFDFERIEALKPAIEACGISTLSQSPMLGFHKQMDNRIKLLEEILSFRMQGVEFDNGDMYVDGHKAASDVRSEERFSRNAETDLVCRLLLEKKKFNKNTTNYFFLMIRLPPISTLFPYTTLFRSCGISTLSQSPMLGFHKQMDNRIKLLEEILSFRMQGVEFDNGDMYVDGHKAASDVRDEFVSVTEKLMDELAQCYNVLPQLDIN